LFFHTLWKFGLTSYKVTHKIRQFEAWLADALENFRIHQEGLISRIPKQVRSMTMREFQKYGGDVQAALRGLQREKLGGGPEGGEIDRSMRKRKWVASQEAEGEASGSGAATLETDTPRAAKSGETRVILKLSIFHSSKFHVVLEQRGRRMLLQKQNLVHQQVLAPPSVRVSLEIKHLET